MWVGLTAEAWSAPCGTWVANLTADPKGYHESMALTYTWDAVSNCDTFSFDHYVICRKRDSDISGAWTTPNESDPDCGPTMSAIGTGTISLDDFVHRSDMDYGVSLFACDNSDCTEFYGDGTHGSTKSDYRAETSTESERWVLEDIYSATAPYSDTDRVIDPPTGGGDAVASAAMIYPPGWTYEDHLMLVWTETNTPAIHYKRAVGTGWQDWNIYSGWSNTDDEGEVVDGISGGAGSFEEPTHPWVAAATDGTNGYIQLYFHSEDPWEIWPLVSVDDVGDDFGVLCDAVDGSSNPVDCTADGDDCPNGELCDLEDVTGDGDGEAVNELCADTGSASCFYLDQAAHGRFLWDYIANPEVNFDSDTPGFLFTGKKDSSCVSSPDTNAPDVMQAGWITGSPGSWQLGTSGTCPDAPVLEDHHDPSMIPLPNGEFKLYSQISSGGVDPDGGHIEVCIWNGLEWEDCRDIVLAFDDTTRRGVLPNDMGLGTLAEIYECVANIDTIVYPDPPDVHHGAFLHTRTGNTKDVPARPCFTSGGIVFAELAN